MKELRSFGRYFNFFGGLHISQHSRHETRGREGEREEMGLLFFFLLSLILEWTKLLGWQALLAWRIRRSPT